MTINKYHVKAVWMKQDEMNMAPIYASSKEQASEIALARMRDARRDFDSMLDFRTIVTLLFDSTVGDFK